MGRPYVGREPSQANHLIPKSYVDSRVWADVIYTGTLTKRSTGFGTALTVERDGVAVGRVDNNAFNGGGIRVQALTGGLQLQGPANTGLVVTDQSVIAQLPITQSTAPSADTHLTTKLYVDQGLAGKANTTHTHGIAQVTGLQAALDGKAGTTHSHPISQVTNLQSALDSKASTAHGHQIADVEGLEQGIGNVMVSLNAIETSLAGKANTDHGHSIGQVTGLQSALDGKANTSHTHPVAQVTGLQAALDGKASTSHSHPISQVTGLQDILDDLAGAGGGDDEDNTWKGTQAQFDALPAAEKIIEGKVYYIIEAA